MNNSREKVLLVMPLSTTRWGSANAGGVDSVCQMVSQYISENCNSQFHYRIVAIEQLSEPKEFDKVLQLSSNVELVWIPSKKKIGSRLSIPSLFYYMYKVRQQVKLYCPNVIHSHLWSAILSCDRSIPSVVTVHSYKQLGRKSVSIANDFLYVNFLPLLYKFYGNCIVCVGEDLKKLVAKDISQSVLSIPNPINEDYFVPLAKTERKNCVVFVTCALLKPKKQIEKTIVLIKQLVTAGVDCRLNIIGPEVDSTYVEYLKALVEKEELKERVAFLGRLNRSQIIKCYEESDIGMFFSKEETFGLVPLEMMAAGLPILATKVGVLAEKKDYFSSVGASFVVVENNIEMLTKAQELLANRKKVDVASLRESYMVSNIVKKYENIYLELLLGV